MFYAMLGVFAEFEYHLKRERQVEGIAREGRRPVQGPQALGCHQGRRDPAELRRHLHRLVLVLEMLAEVEAERDQAIAAAQGKQAALLQLKGIGAESAAVLCAEIFHRAFTNRHDVAAYAGLVPTPFASGATSRDQGISKGGNPRVRRTMVELAWLWVRYQPESALSSWFVARVGTAKGRMRRIAIVAVACKLLVGLWRYLETGLILYRSTEMRHRSALMRPWAADRPARLEPGRASCSRAAR